MVDTRIGFRAAGSSLEQAFKDSADLLKESGSAAADCRKKDFVKIPTPPNSPGGRMEVADALHRLPQGRGG